MDTLLNSRQKIKNSLHEETIIGNPIQFYSGLKGELEHLVLFINQRPVEYNYKGEASEILEPIMAGTGSNLYPFGDMEPNPKAAASYPLQLPAGTYTFQAQSDYNYNPKIILNLSDESEQEVSLSSHSYVSQGQSTIYYHQAVFTITQPTVKISWPIEQQTLYNIQICKGNLIPKDIEASGPLPYVPYERIVPFEEPLSKGTLVLSNKYPHYYNGIGNIGEWELPEGHLAIPFDWQEEADIIWNGIYVFSKNGTYLYSSMQMVTCGESLSPMINLRDSTGGYINTENGLYFECGANTSFLGKYISATSSEYAFSRADSNVLRNGCVDNITDPGYFRMKPSTEYYDQNNYPIMGIELCLPQYCGSTLEEKRAYLASNPIQILYLLSLHRTYIFPAALPEIRAFVKRGINRLDVFQEKFSNQDVIAQFGLINTNSNISIKADFAAPHISYAKQWPNTVTAEEPMH